MAKVKIELNSRGVQALLKSSEMQAVCQEQASAIRGRCGDGYEMDTFMGKTRGNAMVWANTYQAKADNARNNTLLKALK